MVHDAGRIRVNLPCGSCPRALGRHVAAWVAENVERPPGQAILLQEVAFACPIWQIDDPEASMRDLCAS